MHAGSTIESGREKEQLGEEDQEKKENSCAEKFWSLFISKQMCLCDMGDFDETGKP
jgi:hypothetical protein